MPHQRFQRFDFYVSVGVFLIVVAQKHEGRYWARDYDTQESDSIFLVNITVYIASFL